MDTSLAPPETWTDDELAELALAADPDEPLDPSALPIEVVLGDVSRSSTLPQWYMPAVAAASSLRGRRAAIAIGLVVVLLALEALGLCSAYGQVVVG